MAGYTRQDTTGQLANGNPIDADIFNDEYDAIEGAFNASTGHNHDGTAGGGAAIESIGPSTELKVESSAVFPKNDNLIDNGKSALRWKDGHYGGTVYAEDAVINDDVSIGGDLTVTGNATIAGNLTFGDAATDTVDFQADIDSDLKPEAAGYNLGSSTQEWNNLWLDGTANVDNLTVDENGTVAGTFDVTGAVGIDGDFDINTTKFTIAAASGNTAIAGTLGVADVVSVTDLTSATSTSTGAVVVSGGVGVAENLHVGGTLDVAGDVTIADLDVTTLDASGAVGVDGNFDVATNKFTVAAASGNTAIAGTLDVTGNQTNTGDLTVNGNTTLGDAATDTIALTGVVSTDVIPSAGTENLGSSGAQWNNLYIDGTASIDTLAVDENATVTGTLGVTGATTLTGAATLSDTLAVTGAATLSDTLAVTGASTFTGAITASGGVTGNLNGDVTGNVDGIIGGTTPANVTGTTIQFNTGLSDGTITMTGFVDEDDMVSDSPTLIPTQQSVKAYVDAATVAASDLSATTVTATTLDATTADVETLDLGGGAGAGWVLQQNTSTNDLEFIYNGVVQAKLTSAGAFKINAELDAESF
jgi:hypothetical protein